jgi:hypothetical protein
LISATDWINGIACLSERQRSSIKIDEHCDFLMMMNMWAVRENLAVSRRLKGAMIADAKVSETWIAANQMFIMELLRFFMTLHVLTPS